MKEETFDPVKPGTFEREKVDLDTLVHEGDTDKIHHWVEETVTRHRAQAYAHGVDAGRRQRRYNSSADLADMVSVLTPVLLVVALILLAVLR